MLKDTAFGFIVTGTMKCFNVPRVSSCNFFAEQLNFEKFWESEEIPSLEIASKNNDYCETVFQDSFSRNHEGRYVVKYPLLKNNFSMPPSRKNALQRFYQIEGRFNKHPELKTQYFEFMKEYLQLGHMELASDQYADGGKINYLIHHPVFKDDKIRIVFDGSFCHSPGFCLNSMMPSGPVVQPDLFSLLINFRFGKYAFCADIQKFYRQVLITPEQRDLQRIVWRFEQNSPPQAYRLNTVTYGLTASAFLSTRSLLQLASDNEVEFPLATNLVKNNFYVDDLVYSSSDKDVAIDSLKQLICLLKKGCFPLAKWRSNAIDILDQLQLLPSQEFVSLSDKNVTKTLGLVWDAKEDKLIFSTQKSPIPVTKRSILSEICKLFDPLGLLSPCIITAKILMQSIWKIKIDWDEQVPVDLMKSWSDFFNKLFDLNNLTLPRYIPIFEESNNLHVFCDASSAAYAAVAYVVSNNSSFLIASKTRVAPVKTALTVPKLELCAALLGATLADKLIKISSICFHNVFLWSDAQVVLNWISKPPAKWTPYVANRVIKIQSLTKDYKWLHVPTKLNPADIASRGMQPNKLITCEVWWHGPAFLLMPMSQWPLQDIDFSFELCQVNTAPFEAPAPPLPLFTKFFKV